jgi:GAF domain-containing protein
LCSFVVDRFASSSADAGSPGWVEQDQDTAAALRRYELLFEVTDGGTRADTLQAIYDLALDSVERALGVSRSAVLVCDAEGVMRFVAWRGLSDAYRRGVEAHSPWRRDDPDPRSVFVGDAQRDPAWEAHRSLFQTERIGALGFIPLHHEGRLLGRFMVYSPDPRAFTDEEIRLAEAVAAQVAQAVALPFVSLYA